MCFKYLSSCLSANEGNIRKARDVRDENLTCFENTNIFFSLLLAVFGFTHLICGAKFINDNLVDKGHGMVRL